MIKSKLYESISSKDALFPIMAKLIAAPDVVLFTSECVGTVIVGSIYKLGRYDTNWISCFDTAHWTIPPQGSKVELIQS